MRFSSFHPIRAVREEPRMRLLLLFCLEGFLLQYTTSLFAFGNNFYATNLGASDTQIALVQTIPNLVAVVFMIPVGLLANRTRSSRSVPFWMSILVGFAYFAYATVPAFGEYRMAAFFIFLGMTVGGISLYNAQWQTFFGDAVQPNLRNGVLTHRNRLIFVISIFVPFLCGNLLTAMPNSDAKLVVLRIFFYTAGLCMLVQAFVLRRIPCPERHEADKVKIGLSAFKDAFHHIFRHKAFRSFFVCIMLFYFTWHIDWSISYIAQTQYFGMNEVQLSLLNSVGALLQTLFVGFFGRLCTKRSENFTMVTVASALVIFPLASATALLLPFQYRAVFFMICSWIGCIPMCAIGMCFVQMVLQVTPEKNRALIISVYTLFVTLSNSFMPLLGVRIYTALGSTEHALKLYYFTLTAARIAVAVLLFCRYRKLKKTGDLFRPLA